MKTAIFAYRKKHVKMNKRIKMVWALSIVTMVLILCGQAYWLLNQYRQTVAVQTGRLKTVCTEALVKEQRWRSGMTKEGDKLEKYGHIRYMLKIDTDNKSTESSITFTLPEVKKKIVVRNVSMNNGVDFLDRYTSSLVRRLDKHHLDSLINSAGHDTTEHFRFYKTKRCMVKPVFSVSGTFGNRLDVKYSSNPLMFEAVAFSISIRPSKVLTAMGWQLAGSALLVIILASCMAYQIKTIIIQKRIDGIRHEFMKNMIYEMKQPPASEPAESEAIKLGETDFFYTFNELRHGSEKVIITSRQAEILRLLAMRRNTLVSREELLTEVWGDDSYANSKALNVQITYLRRALKSDPTVTIEAVIKKGYILKVKE